MSQERIARSIYGTGVADMGSGRLKAAAHNLKRALAMCPGGAFAEDARVRLAAVAAHLAGGGSPDEALAAGGSTGASEGGGGGGGGGDAGVGAVAHTITIERYAAPAAAAAAAAAAAPREEDAAEEPMPRAALVVGASVRVAGRGAATICEVDGPLVFYEYGGGEGSEGSSHPKRRYHRNVLARSTGAACFLKPEAVAAAAAGDGGAAAAREKAAHQQLLDSGRYAGKVSAAEMSGWEY